MDEYVKLKKAREDLGLNQTDLASILGVSQRDVSKMENGEKKFMPKKYIEFLSSKGYDINSLFDDEMPLLKRKKEPMVLREQGIIYNHGPDERLKTTLKRSLKIESNEHLNALFERFDENNNSTVNLFEMLILHTWEKVYLSRLNQLEREIRELKNTCNKTTTKKPGKTHKNI